MRFLEPLLAKMYIGLLPATTGHYVYGELRKNAKVLKRFDTQFCQTPSEVSEAVTRLSRESALSYVVLLEFDAKQGVLSSCSTSGEIELSSVERVCFEKRWGIYMDKDDLFEIQKRHKSTGLDLLFSPFSLLYNFFKETIAKQDGLYLLLTERYIVSMVFKENRALFAEVLNYEEAVALADSSKTIEICIEQIQSCVKAFYDAKVDEKMFIEQLFIADTRHFDTRLENSLEETLFVEVEKRQIDLEHELLTLAEKELL